MEELCLAMEKLSLSSSDKLCKSSTTLPTGSQLTEKLKNRKGGKKVRCWKCHKVGHKKKFCHSNKPMRVSRKSDRPITKKGKYKRQRVRRSRKWKCQMDMESERKESMKHSE